MGSRLRRSVPVTVNDVLEGHRAAVRRQVASFAAANHVPVVTLTAPTATSGERASCDLAFAGFRFPREVISQAVRWYLRYGVSYRDAGELLAERGAIHQISGSVLDGS